MCFSNQFNVIHKLRFFTVTFLNLLFFFFSYFQVLLGSKYQKFYFAPSDFIFLLLYEFKTHKKLENKAEISLYH